MKMLNTMEKKELIPNIVNSNKRGLPKDIEIPEQEQDQISEAILAGIDAFTILEDDEKFLGQYGEW